MTDLGLQYEACVRTRSRSASCAACAEACPDGAIAIEDGAVVVSRDRCSGCGACAAVCPTEALSGPVDVATVVAGAGGAVACGPEGCLGGLHVEDWLAIASGVPAVRVAACPACVERVEARLVEVRAALGALGSGTTLALAPGRAVPRSGGAGELRFEPLRLVPARMRRKGIPERRRRLLAAVLPPDGPATLSAAQASWTSGKRLDVGTCTACRMCVSVCPTGALAASRRWDEITFDAGACVACGLCHDVCAPEALTRADEVDLASVWAGRVPLGRLPVQRCVECGETFVGPAGERCARCADLDDEARALVGWTR